jgi:hypothetical protein
MYSHSCSPMLRARRGGGRPTRTRCGWRWRPTIDYCVTRSRLTVARSSTSPETGCVRCSPPPSGSRFGSHSAAGTGVAGSDGHRHRRGGAARRRLLRNGAQPHRASHGSRPRRTDPARRRNRGSARRCRSDSIGIEAVTRYRQLLLRWPDTNRRRDAKVPEINKIRGILRLLSRTSRLRPTGASARRTRP